jgi:hypothetical protein
MSYELTEEQLIIRRNDLPYHTEIGLLAVPSRVGRNGGRVAFL